LFHLVFVREMRYLLVRTPEGVVCDLALPVVGTHADTLHVPEEEQGSSRVGLVNLDVSLLGAPVHLTSLGRTEMVVEEHRFREVSFGDLSPEGRIVVVTTEKLLDPLAVVPLRVERLFRRREERRRNLQ